MQAEILSLEKEYVNRFKQYSYFMTRFTEFARFSIHNGRLIAKTKKSLVFAFCIFTLVNISTSAILIEVMDRLLVTEICLVILFTGYYDTVVIDINFLDSNRGAEILHGCMQVDAYLGTNETKFMRDAEDTYYNWCSLIAFMLEVFTMVVLFLAFSFMPCYMYLPGYIFFLQAFASYYDIVFFLGLHGFHSMRIRYLNVALMKLTNMNPEYLTNPFPFYGLFWKKEYDMLVRFHERTDSAQLIKAYTMILDRMDHFHKSFRVIIMMCALLIITGTLLVTQSFVILVKRTDITITRVIPTVAWSLISWVFNFGFTTQIDTYQQQLEQTRQICTFAQLTPSNSKEVFKLTKRLLRTLQVKETRHSIYGIFYYETGILVRMIAAVVVYITAQLQISFPVSISKGIGNTTLQHG